MSKTLRLFFVAVISSLVLAPVASAHHWHDGNQPWWTGQPTADQPTPDQPVADPPPAAQPVAEQPPADQPAPDSAGSWNPYRGDPQETPAIWNKTPPVQTGNGKTNPGYTGDRTPWS